MAAVIGSLRAELSASIAKFQSDLGKAANSVKAVSSEFTKVGKEFQRSGAQLQQTGKALTKTLTLPLLAIGAAAIASAKEFDEAFDSIRASTGATGQDFKDLQQSFTTVFKGVPNQASEVADAIGEISQRTGAVGEDLEELATNVLNLARLTKTSAGAIAASTTRVFGDWSIATKNQSEALNFLFKTTQQTGIEIGKLSDLVVQFGAPMRALGFTFEETAALLGKFEQEGVNIETVMSGLRFALGKFAAAGKEPAAAFKQVADQIKNAKTESEATAIAFQNFGKRAAVDMSRAIIEGRFEIEALVKSLNDSKETINDAAKETLSFSERLEIFRHKIVAILEPLGSRLLGALEDLEPHFLTIVNALDKLIQAFTALPRPVQAGLIAIGGAAAVIGPIAFLAGQAISALGTLAGQFGKTGLATVGLTKLVDGLSKALIALRNIQIGSGLLNILLGGATAGAAGLAIGGAIALVASQADQLQKDLENAAKAAKGGREPIKALAKDVSDFDKAMQGASQSGQDLHDGLEVVLKDFKAATTSTAGPKTFAQQLADARAQIAALTPAVRRDLVIALKSGVFEMTALKEQTGLSELALKLFGDQLKETAKDLTDTKAELDDVREAFFKIADAVEKLQEAAEEATLAEEFADVARQIESLDARTEELQTSAEELDAALDEVFRISGEVSRIFEEGTDKTDEWDEALDDLAKSFAQLAQVSDGAFGSVVKDIATVISAMQLARNAVELFKEGLNQIKLGNKTEAFLGLAGATLAGGAAVGQATATGGIASRGAKGALTGAILGAEIGTAILPVLGTAAGAAIGAIAGGIAGVWRGIAAKIHKEMQVNPIRAAFFAQAGHELESLNPLILELTGNLDTVQALFDAETPEQWEEALRNINQVLEQGRQRFLELQEAVGLVDTRLSELIFVTPDLQAAIDKAFTTTTPSGFLQALKDINTEIDEQQGKFDTIKATLDEYGLALDDATSKEFQQQLTDVDATDIIEDFKVLKGAGVEVNLQMQAMSDRLNAFVQNAQKAGVEVPESMRSILQTAIDAGQLFSISTDELGALREAAEKAKKSATSASGAFDSKKFKKAFDEAIEAAKEGGVEFGLTEQQLIDVRDAAIEAGGVFDDSAFKVKDLSELGLKFGTTMETTMANVGTAIDKLLLVLEGFAKFLGVDLPKAAEDGAEDVQKALDGIEDPVVTVKYKIHDFEIPEEFGDIEFPVIEGAASGALVKKWGLQHLQGGGFAKGTDTVPAMLTPGELVLNKAQQGNLAAALAQPVVINQTWNITGVLTETNIAGAINRVILPKIHDAYDNNVAGARTRGRDVLGITGS